MPGRHMHATGERLDVQRLRVLPINPIANAQQPREVTQLLRRSGLLVTSEIVPRRAGGASAAAVPPRVRSGPVCSAYVLDLLRP
ncbi:MAG: hypothetical protein ACRDTA_11725 [Pseudonocardiaceae bacterium]